MQYTNHNVCTYMYKKTKLTRASKDGHKNNVNSKQYDYLKIQKLLITLKKIPLKKLLSVAFEN